MGFGDIFKNSFIARFTSEDITVLQIFGVLCLVALISVYIFGVYRLVTRKTFYSKNFNISIAALAMITAAIILAVQSNIVISLGMVGALSIVRFRTAVKDPMDLCFMFWAIAVGICCGAHMTEIAIILSVFMTLLVFALDKIPMGRAPMILVVNMDDIDTELELVKKVKEYCKYFKIKSRNIRENNCNLVIEVRVKEEYQLVQGVKAVKGIKNVSLVSHDGEAVF
mgnify:FL=1